MPRKPDADPVAVAALLARILASGSCSFERTEAGVSTVVYRVRRCETVFYLRLAEEREDSLAPEVYVHRLLREWGVRVPEIVHFEPFDEGLQRSAMLTTAIAGEPLSARWAGSAVREILRDAGRDLALINRVPVEGFGWIKRDSHEVTGLEADHPTHAAFIAEHLAADLELLGAGVLTSEESAALRAIIDRSDAYLEVDEARLAHGDFDLTHIYQQGERYSGLIDFGEIRGADPLYDLAHFKLHDGEMLPRALLPDLLAGYETITPLSSGWEQRLRLLSLLIGVRAFAHGVGRPHTVFLARRIRELIAEFGCSA